MALNDLIKRIEEDLKLQKKDGHIAPPENLDGKWDVLVRKEPTRFINDDMTIRADILRNFRKYSIFISDAPSFNPSTMDIRNLLYGGRRGAIRLLKESLSIIKEQGHDALLKKYPSNLCGNPHVFRYYGHEYTYRWLKHIHSLGLFKKYLENRLGNRFTALDIGSSYGIFSYLLKKEFGHSTHILLDFPEQLVLAYYFLGMSFPNARIAGYKELSDMGKIDRNLIEQYDFILLPWFFYEKLAPQSVDLTANFASLGEMKRKWFDYYLKSEPFLSTKYFFTANRFQSAPTYDTDLTILDYPLHNFSKLHFAISPVFSHTYARKNLFFYEKLIFSSQYFEFIGERK